MDSIVSTCRICGAPGPHTAYMGREMMFGTRERFEYFECSRCGCLQIASLPQDLATYYPANYYSFSSNETIRCPGRLRRVLERQRTYTALFRRRYKLSRIAKLFVSLPNEIHEGTGEVVQRAHLKDFNASILDVGCGSSAVWLRRMALLGFRHLTGVDPFVDRDLSIGRVRILRKNVDEVRGQFDLVRLSHSLEHIPDQQGTLAEIRRLLAPGGTVLIRVPIVPSVVWERYRANWAQMDPPRHLYLHTERSLQFVAGAAGLRLVHRVYDSSAFSWWASEQYARDIPLMSDASYWVDPDHSIFATEEIEEFARLAEQANRAGIADQAAFYLTCI